MTYFRFCVKFELNPVPASQHTLVAYLTFLARTLKASSINGYLNVIRILHAEAGLPNPLENNFEISNLKKGITRVLGSLPDQKLPITSEILLMIKSRLCFISARDIVFWSACLTAYFGLLRKSTLLPTSMPNPGDACIRRHDLCVESSSVFILYIRKTKTIQNNERILCMPYVSCPESPLCPYKAMMDLLLVAPKDKDLPLFSYKCRGKILSMTHSIFTTKLKSLISDIGLDATRYSGHSFRRGGATLGFEVGLTLSEIKTRGDWKSNAVNEYVVIRDITKLARTMVEGANDMLKC